jgi:hypothetical protein
MLSLVLMAGMAMAAETASKEEGFSPGQVWTFKLDPSEPAATLTILKVEKLEKIGDVVHISVSAVRVPGGVMRINHLPFSRKALEKSVVKLVGAESVPSELPGYETWKRANGGVFKTSVSDAMTVVRQSIETRATPLDR